MLVHIMTMGYEFIGEVGEHWADRDMIKIRKAVKLRYINSPKGHMMLMENLLDGNNYEGEVHIYIKSGAVIIPLQELGVLAKNYRQALSDLVLSEKKIIAAVH